MKKVKSIFKKIGVWITKYVYTNRLFLSYLLLSICGTIIVREITINSGFSLEPLFTDIGVIVALGSIGYLVKPQNQFKYFFSLIIFFTVLEVINSIYYTFYVDFVSLSLLASLSQVGTVADSVFDKIRLVDFIYILQPLIFYYIHNSLKSSSYYNIMSKIEKGKLMFIFTLVVGGSLIIYSFATATATDYSRLSKQWNRTYIVERFGILVYQFNDAVQTIIPKINSLFGSEEAYELVDEYFETKENYDEDNKYTGILEGYNIVYVHMESMQSFLMDLEFNGEEVTPNLNALAEEGMYFSNFYSPVSTGTSSDAEYMMTTGLLPSSSGTVFVSYANNNFKTIVEALAERGYYTFSMHGNYASMWNRSKVHPKLGYQDMYFRDSYTFDEEEDVIGLGINDKLFFSQAIEYLEEIEENNENYFGTIITLSNHSPFATNEAYTYDIADYYIDEETGEEVSSCYLCDDDLTIGKYIVSSHYADEALGEFIEYIKNSDYFENTIFIFYGDHDAKISYKEMNYLYNYDYLTGELKTEEDEDYVSYDIYDHYVNKNVPLIIWTKNEDLKKIFTGTVDTVMAMYDVVPTLYNMLNIDDNEVLGHDIFNIGDDNVVVFPNGNFLTDKVYYNNSTGEYKVLVEDVVLDSDYINNYLTYAENLLDVSNAIIQYNYFARDTDEEDTEE